MEILILMEIVIITNQAVLLAHQDVLWFSNINIFPTAGIMVSLIFMDVQIVHLIVRLVQPPQSVLNVL